MRKLCGAVAALVVSLSLLTATAASHESVPARVAKPCGTLNFGGSPYGVQGKGVTCHFMRIWTRRYQNQGKHPRHWSCVGRGEFTDGGRCQDRRDDDYFEYYIQD